MRAPAERSDVKNVMALGPRPRKLPQNRIRRLTPGEVATGASCLSGTGLNACFNVSDRNRRREQGSTRRVGAPDDWGHVERSPVS